MLGRCEKRSEPTYFPRIWQLGWAEQIKNALLSLRQPSIHACRRKPQYTAPCVAAPLCRRQGLCEPAQLEGLTRHRGHRSS